jgi:hypothetical protein
MMKFTRTANTCDANLSSQSVRDQRTHEIRCPSFVLALITIAFEVHSDAAIHSEDLTREPARARVRKGEGDVP